MITPLARTRKDGVLTSLYKTAVANYETQKKYKPGSRSLGERPWECFSQTAAN